MTCCARDVDAVDLAEQRRRVLRCLRRMARIGVAISSAREPAVATWYSSGWNRWWLRRSMTVTCTGACASAFAADKAAEAGADDDDLRQAAPVPRGALLRSGSRTPHRDGDHFHPHAGAASAPRRRPSSIEITGPQEQQRQAQNPHEARRPKEPAAVIVRIDAERREQVKAHRAGHHRKADERAERQQEHGTGQ